MHFQTMSQIKSAIKILKAENPTKRVHYPILFKRALIEFMATSKHTRGYMHDQTGIATSALYNWRNQYDDGLYTIEGAYAVSPKSLTLNGKVLAELNQQLTALQKKIDLVKECEEAGVKVST